MKRVVVINSCVRGKDSRTLKIADSILNHFKDECEINEIDLNKLNLVPYNSESFDEMCKKGVDAKFYILSKQIATSDILFIKAPFWDMGIPALLKTFLEKISIADVMFKDDGKTCTGISYLTNMFYVTTRGMNIEDGSELEQATPYLKALCFLWGIDSFECVSAYNLDYSSEEEINKKINEAIKVGIEKFSKVLKK